ncbi:helix-turn-helix domain-containing protein [Rhodococcus qingshengii]|uniref:helix-turn-helix domain-containing protein n=1 Tax=Rhodococcus qingshengii TaxID=334542 RepID=UPI00105CB66B|nr:helix-turn-helix domain-containing protein [Rhodococcus qingshengii]UDF20118.1 helix-turn-helix domain-containing protein [Rhodococcus qingshengii]
MPTAPEVKPDVTITELQSAPPTVSLWPTAGQALGIGRSHAYKLASSGEFPARVLRLGGTYRVLTADLLSVLGIDAT